MLIRLEEKTYTVPQVTKTVTVNVFICSFCGQKFDELNGADTCFYKNNQNCRKHELENHSYTKKENILSFNDVYYFESEKGYNLFCEHTTSLKGFVQTEWDGPGWYTLSEHELVDENYPDEKESCTILITVTKSLERLNEGLKKAREEVESKTKQLDESINRAIEGGMI